MTATAAPCETTPPALWRRAGIRLLAATSLLGLIYAVVELYTVWDDLCPLNERLRTEGCAITDLPLILIVIANNAIIYRFGSYIAGPLGQLFAHLPDFEAAPQKGVDSILGHRWSVPFGLLYTAILAGGAWLLNPWPEHPNLRWLFALFLFSGSVYVGMGIFAILQFWRLVLRHLAQFDLRLMNLSRAPLTDILRINSRIVMVTAIVASLAILSVVLAGYQTGPLIIVFSMFALCIVVATYAVPILPISNLLLVQKSRELDRVERLIEAHLRRLTGERDRPLLPGEEPLPDKLPELPKLIEARDIIAAIRTLPPGGQISVSAAAIVTFLSFLPSIIDYLVKYVLG